MSDKDKRLKAEELFNKAADLPMVEQTPFLDQECGSNSELRAEVESLLECLEDSQIDSLKAIDQLDESALELTGKKIGPYKLIRLMGEGGFGSVYMAEQESPIHRMVALKIIKLGMDTKKVIARFEAERQALAMMDHPNIAKVLDAGATDTGRPYFVMELVNGVPITEFCDEKGLSMEQRLELFTRVCQAVQHAHLKGIIHRDLKPSNVLVFIHDGVPIPKVIDFGIAKATNKQLTEETFLTEYCHFLGTPEYMSPEQAGLDGQDIDTRTDIYSLGVLLYVLLTGRTPFDWKTLGKAAYGEVQRIIREVDPPTPSQALSRLGPDLKKVAKCRRVTPSLLSKTMQGDLDWIVMKSLEKERSRRYETAADLAADIQRHIEHEPVWAGPPGAAYKVSKFIRRHRIGVTATAVTAAALIVGLSLALMGFFQAERARQQENIHRRLAENEVTKFEAVNSFLHDMMESVNPSRALGREITMRRVLDEAAKKIDEGSLAEQPGVEAAVRMTLGDTYRALGLFSTAEGHYYQAEKINMKRQGEDHPETLLARSKRSKSISLQERYVEAEELFRLTYEKQKKILGMEHPDTMYTLNGLAVSLWRQDEYKEAEKYHREALEIELRVFGDDDPSTIRSLVNLGTVLYFQSRLDEAEECLREGLAKDYKVFGPDHPESLSTMNNLGLVMEAKGNLGEAIELYQKAANTQHFILGANHVDTKRSANNLARLYKKLGQKSESKEDIVKKLKSGKHMADKPDADASTINSYAWILLTCEPAELQNPKEALLYAQKASRLTQGRSPDILDTMALAYHRTSQLDKAIKVQRDAVIFSHIYSSVDMAQLEMRFIQYLQDKLGMKGMQMEKDYLELFSLAPKKGFSSNGGALFHLGQGLIRREKYKEAQLFLWECLNIRQKTLPVGHELIADAKVYLGSAIAGLKQFEEAEKLMIEGISSLDDNPFAKNTHRNMAVRRIIKLYEAWGYPDKVKKWKKKLEDDMEDDIERE